LATGRFETDGSAGQDSKVTDRLVSMRFIRSVITGVVAGAVGTLAMDLTWYRRYRSGGGNQGFIPWETSEGTTGYEEAAAPARTAKAVADMVGIELPDASARTMNNVVHWLTGLSWGGAHGTVVAAARTSNPLIGLATAVTAWATSYAVLPKLGIYEQMSEYDNDVLWKDLSAHLVFGAALGLSYRIFSADPD
jgi:hypothetical protein